jgi:MFS transporter, OFA family, oxalate/formate antiporter
MSEATKNRGWTVTFSGTGINLALGILYTWSIFKGAISTSMAKGGPGAFQWDPKALNDPYAICCLVFAFAMILAGRIQDKFGPRVTACIGGVLVGIGFIWISQTTSYAIWIIGFGLLAGTGIGFGYSAATPPALKWFPPERTGLIAGLVVSGFGLASVYIAPLGTYLVGIWGLQSAMLFFGIAFLIVVCGLSMMLVNPPQGFSPVKAAPQQGAGSAKAAPVKREVRPSEVLKTLDFYILWIIYVIGAGAGLMVISSVAGMAQKSMGASAFIAVAILAIGNAAGRIIAGLLSDRIGRSNTLIIMLLFQSLLMFVAIPVVGAQNASGFLVVVIATFLGFNYGTNLSLFPSYCKDLWGLKNFGINYGLLFSAWGVGGFVLSRLSQMFLASTGRYTYSFVTAGILLIIGALLTIWVKGRMARPSTGQNAAMAKQPA